MIRFIEPEELFETQNPALQKVNDFRAKIDEKVFRKNVNKVVDIVAKHFKLRR